MGKLRVVHYVNQFFAGVGGEEKAGVTPNSKDGTVWPEAALNVALGKAGVVVVTVYCGDNYMSDDAGECSWGSSLALVFD